MTIVGSELRYAFERMVSKPYIDKLEAVPWHVLERSASNPEIYSDGIMRQRWADFQAGAALASTAPRDGWVMVRARPTDEQCVAGLEALAKVTSDDPIYGPALQVVAVYRAMVVDAAPSVGEG